MSHEQRNQSHPSLKSKSQRFAEPAFSHKISKNCYHVPPRLTSPHPHHQSQPSKPKSARLRSPRCSQSCRMAIDVIHPFKSRESVLVLRTPPKKNRSSTSGLRGGSDTISRKNLRNNTLTADNSPYSPKILSSDTHNTAAEPRKETKVRSCKKSVRIIPPAIELWKNSSDKLRNGRALTENQRQPSNKETVQASESSTAKLGELCVRDSLTLIKPSIRRVQTANATCTVGHSLKKAALETNSRHRVHNAKEDCMDSNQRLMSAALDEFEKDLQETIDNQLWRKATYMNISLPLLLEETSNKNKQAQSHI